jgi:hypothetical protein
MSSGMLAEVSDKIPAAWGYWLIHGFVALLACLFARASRPEVLPLLCTCCVVWMCFGCWFAFSDDPLRDAAVRELGVQYFIQQAVASALPLLAVFSVWLGRAKSQAR